MGDLGGTEYPCWYLLKLVVSKQTAAIGRYWKQTRMHVIEDSPL